MARKLALIILYDIPILKTQNYYFMAKNGPNLMLCNKRQN